MSGRPWTRLLTVVPVLALVAGVLAATPPSAAAAVPPVSGVPPTTSPSGYWLATAGGQVVVSGAAGVYQRSGGPASSAAHAHVVGIARTPSSDGYWLAAADGAVVPHGDAGFFGSALARPGAPVVAIAATPDGQGYWLLRADGTVLAFGDAGMRGSATTAALGSTAVGFAPTPTGNGYWVLSADGTVLGFGDATLHGSATTAALGSTAVAIAGTPTGNGYWVLGADGTVLGFGDAAGYGSATTAALGGPAVALVSTLSGHGYWVTGATGTVLAFGDATTTPAPAVPAGAGAVVGMAAVGPTVGGQVLLVGTYHGIPGQYTSIQAAVDAARPGDWVLVAPGDYHPTTDLTHPPSAANVSNGWNGGIEISTPDLHVRGMNRATTIIDGTKAGSPTCSSNPADQQLGETLPGQTKPIGRNGIVVWKADNVTIQNLTVCNFLQANGNGGNEIWWNGGSGSGAIGMAGYSGSYLTATSSFDGTVAGEQAAGLYGIFSNSAAGPGVWNQIYANNFTDSGMYIGACQQACDAWIHNAWMENSALGYSGTNSGGTMVIDHSQFDNNEDGFDTNTQSVGDPPPPQNGTCPSGGVSAITKTTSCWVFMQNYVHGNNNPNAPGYGAVAQPTGTGMTVSGATHDTIMNNLFADNGAWGTLFVPYPDTSPGGPGVCTGSGGHLALGVCLYDPEADALLNNTYVHNGFFGNPSNGDYGEITFFPNEPQNCFAGNVAPDGSSPANLEQTQPTCGALTTQTVSSSQLGQPGSLINQVLCDTGFASSFGQSCTPSEDKYPTPSANAPVLTSVPTSLPTMPNPCQGVPANAWCPPVPAGKAVPTTTVGVPASGSTLTGGVYLDASASSPTGVRRVRFVLSGGGLHDLVVSGSTATTVGYIGGFDTTTVPNGTYQLRSEAFGDDGVHAFSPPVVVSVLNHRLRTRVLVPGSGAVVTGGSVLDASATGLGPVTSVRFALTGNGLRRPVVVGRARLTGYGWIALLDPAGLYPGAYKLVSMAVDDRGEHAVSVPIPVTLAVAPPG